VLASRPIYYTDVISTTYGHWRIDAGQFVVTEFYTSDGTGRITSTSAAYRVMAEQMQVFSDTITLPPLPAKNNLYAFLMAASRGWNNYRHQADVLQMYQLLKQNGLPDDRIILVMEDDLANAASNPLPGIVKNTLDGENLYHNVEIDYKLSGVSTDDLKNILCGNVTPGLLVMSKSLGKTYKKNAKGNYPPHKMLADKISRRDPGAAPQPGERVRYTFYVIDEESFIAYSEKTGKRIKPTIKISDRIESPDYIERSKLDIDYTFTAQHHISKPVKNILKLISADLPKYYDSIIIGNNCSDTNRLERHFGHIE